jgi:hypothetical protein
MILPETEPLKAIAVPNTVYRLKALHIDRNAEIFNPYPANVANMASSYQC